MTIGTDAAGGSLILLLFTCLCVAVIFGVHLAITYWIYNDARKRGNPNAVIWAVLNFLSDPLGLMLYMLIGRNQTTPLSGPPASESGPPPTSPAPPESTTRL